jgi:hypothetical protein
MSFLLLLAAAMVLGIWFTRVMPLSGHGVDLWICRLLAGLALCAGIVLVTGSLSLRAAQYVVALVAIGGLIVECLRYLRRRPSDARDPGGSVLGELAPQGFLEWASLAAVAGALFLSLLGALAPATGWDAGVAHLSLPKDYAREGRIFVFEGNEYSAYPHLAHCLFAQVFFGNGETLTALLSWVFAVSACGAAFALGLRIENRRCAWVAAAIFATAPIFMDQAGSVSLDLAFTAFTLAALTCLTAWRDTRQHGWLWLGAFLAGSSCGIRHTGYLVCVLLMAGAFVFAPDRRLRAVASLGRSAH